MATKPTIDTLAIGAVLRGDYRALHRLRTAVTYLTGSRCPHCDAGSEAIEDNGQSGRGLAFLCTACEHQWDACDVEV